MVEYDSFFLALITSLISFILGFISAYLRDWLKQRKEKKKINKTFLKIFEGFCSVDAPQRAHLSVLINILNLDSKLLSGKLEMMIGIEYTPERMSISKRTDGRFNEYKIKEENEAQFPFEQEILRRFSLNMSSNQDFYVMNNKLDSLLVRMEDENWLVLIGLSLFFIAERSTSPPSQFDYRNLKNSDVNILINFLKDLELKYKKAKIIKKDKILVNDDLISKLRKIKENN